MKYSELMHGLRLKGIELDRSVLADMALLDEPAFAALVKEAKSALPAAAH
jgi:large subunit ribosomal protein L20